jgi:hypothetical protein
MVGNRGGEFHSVTFNFNSGVNEGSGEGGGVGSNIYNLDSASTLHIELWNGLPLAPV